MNSPQRAVATAMPRVRQHLGRLTAAVVTAAALVCFAADPAQAMTRSRHAQAHSAAQEQEPGPAHVRAHQNRNGASAKKSEGGRRSSTAARRSEAPVRAAKNAAPATAHAKSRRGRPLPEPEADPVSMRRASRERGSRAEQVAAAAGTSSRSRRRKGTSEREDVREAVHDVTRPAAGRTPAHVAAAVRGEKLDVASHDGKSPDTGDFIRAATGTAPADAGKPASVFAEGVSHPDEMDEQATMPVVRAARPLPTAARAVLPATPLTPVPAAPQRVEGFGAEGAVLNPGHRTLARTLAAHRNDPLLTAKAPVFSGAEQNEITEEAIKPVVVPAVFSRNGRMLMPAPLKGSRDVLVHQNLMADHDGLERIQDDGQLDELLDSHQLARLPESGSLHVNPELPENRRYARPWTVKFATDLGRAYADRFGVPLQVNSAVRTVTYQLRLMRVNGNAAAVEGDTASPHLTGQAIDIGKRGMSKAQLAWMRAYLLPLMQAGKIDVEEEFQQACFHVSVYRGYLPAKRKMQVAAVTRRAAVQDDAAPRGDDDTQ